MPHWKLDYLVGVEPMDRQHEEMFRMFCDCYESISQGQGKATISAILDRLIKYTGTHFEAEEQLMRDSGYLAPAEHTAVHREFTQQVLQLQNASSKSRQGLTLEMLCLLKEWLDGHVHHLDSQYGPAVRAHLAGWGARSAVLRAE